MKTLKRIIPLLLAMVLTLGLLPLGAYATEDEIIPAEDPSEEIGEATPSPEAEATTPPESLPADTDSEILDEPSETPESPETTIEPEAAPSEETAPPVAEETTSPQPEETVEPETEASPSPVPEDESPIIDGVSFYGQPWGEGIFFAPDDFLPSVVPFVMSASGTATIDVRGCYDSNSNIIRYASSFSYAGRVVGGYNTARHTIYANDEPAYCLEPGKLLFAGNVVTISAASVWNDLGTAKQNAIKLALLCGAEGNKSNLPGSYGSQYTATQMVIWEIVVGVRNTSEPYSCTDNKVINSVCSGGANSEVKAVYDQIVADMQSYNTLPSFANSKNAPPPQQEMAYSGGKYTLVLNDTNKVLENYKVTSSDDKVTVKTDGNKLTITSSVAVKGVNINFTRKNPTTATSQITAYGQDDLIILLLVFAAGLVYCLWPQIMGWKLEHDAHVAVSEFFELAETAKAGKQGISFEYVDTPGTEEPLPNDYPELFAAMQEYNREIYANGQSGLCDAWAYQQPSFSLTDYGVESNTIGVIDIPAMNVELPIYLGATSENMAAGAVHLSQTSLPIGGENTNCVIAAHRGWYGAPYFRYIDILKPGDEVRITNLWETLVYRVAEIKVIDPDDIDEILIQPGRELLTLVTCHPYASGGLYRYVVYCERVPS